MRGTGLGVLSALLVAAWLGGVASPERMILTGTPPWGPSWVVARDGSPIPAGCGPEAARILLAYYDRRCGYRFVLDDPQRTIEELHQRMGTITVTWDGVRQGLTWPWAFAAGLQRYIEQRCPQGVLVETAGGSLEAVFARSVALIQQGVPQVILFDWQGTGGIFPNHYAVVVGYDLSVGRKQLVLNPGWGYDFQLLDMTDARVAPVSLYWIEASCGIPEGEPGAHTIPPSAAGLWERDEDGNVQLRPVLRLHNDPQSTVRWPRSSQVQLFLPGVDDLGTAIWDGG